MTASPLMPVCTAPGLHSLNFSLESISEGLNMIAVFPFCLPSQTRASARTDGVRPVVSLSGRFHVVPASRVNGSSVFTVCCC